SKYPSGQRGEIKEVKIRPRNFDEVIKVTFSNSGFNQRKFRTVTEEWKEEIGGGSYTGEDNPPSNFPGGRYFTNPENAYDPYLHLELTFLNNPELTKEDIEILRNPPQGVVFNLPTRKERELEKQLNERISPEELAEIFQVQMDFQEKLRQEKEQNRILREQLEEILQRNEQEQLVARIEVNNHLSVDRTGNLINAVEYDENGNILCIGKNNIENWEQIFQTIRNYMANRPHQFRLGDNTQDESPHLNNGTNLITSLLTGSNGRTRTRKIFHQSGNSLHPAAFTEEQFEELKNLIPNSCKIRGCYTLFADPYPYGAMQPDTYTVTNNVCLYHRAMGETYNGDGHNNNPPPTTQTIQFTIGTVEKNGDLSAGNTITITNAQFGSTKKPGMNPGGGSYGTFVRRTSENTALDFFEEETFQFLDESQPLNSPDNSQINANNEKIKQVKLNLKSNIYRIYNNNKRKLDEKKNRSNTNIPKSELEKLREEVKQKIFEVLNDKYNLRYINLTTLANGKYQNWEEDIDKLATSSEINDYVGVFLTALKEAGAKEKEQAKNKKD
ncbi:10515_t:CDS:2, partial [Ambispora leptoticha]